MKLKQKGAILIALPLLCEVALLFALGVQFSDAEKELEQIEHTQELARTADNLDAHMLSAATAISGYTQTGRQDLLDKYQAQIKDVPKEVETLKAAAHSVPSGDPALLSEESEVREILMQFEELKRLAHADVDLRSFQLKQCYKKVNTLTEHLHETLSKTSSSALAEIEKARTRKQQTRADILAALVGGIAGSTALAVVLMVVFSRSIAGRLSILERNALNYARNSPLEPALVGDDEIAAVDRNFHRMVEALTEITERERAVVEQSAEIICSLDDDGRFSQINSACERSWGYTPDELIGRRLVSLIEEPRDTTSDALAQARSRQDAIKFENQLKRHDGEMIHMHWSCRWSQPQNSYFCVAEDVTERKRLEQLKADFVNMITHDLRTPLSSMRAILQLFIAGAYGEISDKGKNKLSTADRSLSRLVNLLNDLLSLEKLQQGTAELVLAENDMSQLANDASELVRNLAEQRQIELRLPSEPHPTVCDGERIVQVIANLLGNAIKFSPDGGQITIELLRAGTNGTEVRVRDQGPGIPPDEIEHIFDKFHQVREYKEQNKQGTGLGLAIFKSIVEQHQGKIGVFNNDGVRGATFWFVLPGADRLKHASHELELRAQRSRNAST
ncbi:MAG: ATP-binding protein [Terriglobales bacterium]